MQAAQKSMRTRVGQGGTVARDENRTGRPGPVQGYWEGRNRSCRIGWPESPNTLFRRSWTKARGPSFETLLESVRTPWPSHDPGEVRHNALFHKVHARIHQPTCHHQWCNRASLRYETAERVRQTAVEEIRAATRYIGLRKVSRYPFPRAENEAT